MDPGAMKDQDILYKSQGKGGENVIFYLKTQFLYYATVFSYWG